MSDHIFGLDEPDMRGVTRYPRSPQGPTPHLYDERIAVADMPGRFPRTDLDRLHAVALGERRGHACGKTYLECHYVAGALAVTGQAVWVVLQSWHDQRDMLPMLIRVLREHGYSVVRVDGMGQFAEALYLSTPDGGDHQYVRFTTVRDMPPSGYAVVPMRHGLTSPKTFRALYHKNSF